MVEEKVITLNLKKELVKAKKWRRSNALVRILKDSLKRHVKKENIKIDKKLNEKIWSKSIENPQAKFRIKITKVDEKTVKAELLEK